MKKGLSEYQLKILATLSQEKCLWPMGGAFQACRALAKRGLAKEVYSKGLWRAKYQITAKGREVLAAQNQENQGCQAL